ERLLESGADVNHSCPPTPSRPINEVTALIRACQNGHRACARLLIDHGADTNLARTDGRTALHEACLNGHHECAQLLLDGRANPNQAKSNGATALMQASQKGQVECVKLLLRSADVNVKDKDGHTALSGYAGDDHVKDLLRTIGGA
ncbi:MAG: ankyrin repeat domain-containing protein, partial [Halioglobus sp.]